MAKKMTLMEKFITKLVEGGLSARKAREISKTLVPIARKTVKKELIEATVVPVEDTYTGGDSPAIKDGTTTSASLTKVPVGEVVPVQGAVGVALLQTVCGLTTGPTYKVAAVRGEAGMIAVKACVGMDSFRVKFYPTMEFWGISFPRLQGSLGATSFCKREYYERCFLSAESLTTVLERVNVEASEGPKHRGMVTRLKAVVFDALKTAFGIAA